MVITMLRLTSPSRPSEMPGRSLMVNVMPPAFPTEKRIWLWAWSFWVSPAVRIRERAHSGTVHEEPPQPGSLGLKERLGGITINHDGLVKHQPTALGIVAPDALALRKGGRPAKELAQGFQGPVHPRVLVNGLGIAVHTGDEQDEQGAFDLSRAQLLGECRLGFGHETCLG